MSDSNAVAALLSWCSDRGYWIDPRIQLIASPCGVAVLSKGATIPVDSILVRIPRESVLSVKSTVNGATSPWSAYLQSLPREIPGMPLFWTTHSQNGGLREWLNGTEGAKMLFDAEDNRPSLLRDRGIFHQVAQPVYSKLFQSSPQKIPSSANFYLAYALVSSRAFLVDSYHGLSMVPIADAFNHAQENHVHLESDFDVCPECGSLQRCVHDDATDPDPRSTISENADNFYEMVSNRAIPPHAEVFNTYGETLSNAELLVQYGFILDGNENDRLTWTLTDLAHFSENYLPSSWTWDSVGERPDFQALLSSLTALPWDNVSESEMVHLDRTYAFCLNGDATISHGLWLYFALLLVCSRNEPAEYSQNAVVILLEELLQCQLTLELHFASGDAPPLPDDAGASPYSVILHLARLLASLCRARNARTGKPGVETADLGDILDRLPNDGEGLTKMAISLAMAERSLLDSCTAAWEGLAEYLA
ncbi:hypothetical protein DFH09DRAFT_1143797 [Mycena vulgaris]|nr:hypothetical protein DFH09DRAFT_1143797 [Mycena vulgaris]